MTGETMRKDIAKIRSTHLGWEDHGILTVMLTVEYGGGSCQGIGGYSLDTPVWRTSDGERHEGSKPTSDLTTTFEGRHGTAYGMEFIARVMRAAGVRKWEDLPGRTIFVLQDLPEGASTLGTSRVVGIENLPTEEGEQFVFADLVTEPFVTA